VSIVSVPELHKYMSEPEWSDAQEQAAQSVLNGLEGELEDRLFGAPISLREPVTEIAFVTARSGIVMTEYPVGAVSAIGDVVIGEGDPLPTGYALRDGRVRVAPSPAPSYLAPYPGDRGLASVTLTYSPGWGKAPALVQAIKEKAATVMTWYHDDTMVARATDGQKLPQLPPRTWTDDEVKSLDTFRNLSLVM
jgi:hypothetical protein